jgi:hypothetical protein
MTEHAHSVTVNLLDRDEPEPERDSESLFGATHTVAPGD